MKFGVTALPLSMASLTAFAAGIDGKWVSEMPVGSAEGKTYTLTSTFNLKNESGVLTGTITQTSAAAWMKEMNGKPVDISDGKVDGAKFVFKVKTESKQGEKTAVYEGTLEGDELKGTIKYRGVGITRPFDAKRLK